MGLTPEIPDAAVAAAMQVDFSSEHTSTFPELCQAFGVSVAVSTYQAGKVILLRPREGTLNTHFCDFQSPMGIAWHEGQLALGTTHDVWKFRNFHQLGGRVGEDGVRDAVLLPAARLTTGDIRIHDIAWGRGGELWAVNTRFSCLCTFDGYHSFVPRWRPFFVDQVSAEDRCHLNGLALREGEPAFVTCHAATNGAEGWREHKVDGGCVVDVVENKIVASGLCMPHSPRWHGGRLWFLESGHGRLSMMDPSTGGMEVVAELPGFTRGLDFVGRYAFVGLSQVRETAVFSGIPISEPGRERRCGVWVVDVTNGSVVAFLRFGGSVQEIFAVQVLPFLNPELLTEHAELVGSSFFVPPDSGVA